MSIVEPFHRIRDLKPTAANIPDPSLPDREDHHNHLMHIARANGGKGFPVCRPRYPQ